MMLSHMVSDWVIKMMHPLKRFIVANHCLVRSILDRWYSVSSMRGVDPCTGSKNLEIWNTGLLPMHALIRIHTKDNMSGCVVDDKCCTKKCFNLKGKLHVLRVKDTKGRLHDNPILSLGDTILCWPSWVLHGLAVSCVCHWCQLSPWLWSCPWSLGPLWSPSCVLVGVLFGRPFLQIQAQVWSHLEPLKWVKSPSGLGKSPSGCVCGLSSHYFIISYDQYFNIFLKPYFLLDHYK